MALDTRPTPLSKILDATALERPIVKRFGRKKTKSRLVPKFDGFGGQIGGLKLNLSFITPKSTSLHDFTSFVSSYRV